MDTEFLGLSLVFILLGVTGIVLFYGPMNAAGDSCYCIIPSPEPGAAQGTSSIFLALGLMFFPMGLMKGGLPSLGRRPVTLAPGPGMVGKTTSPSVVSSGSLVGVGIALSLVGIDALLVPGVLVFMSPALIAVGAVATAVGVAAIFWGLKRPKSG